MLNIIKRYNQPLPFREGLHRTRKVLIELALFEGAREVDVALADLDRWMAEATTSV